MASGYFTHKSSEYIEVGDDEAYSGGACECNVRYESTWTSGNTHRMTVWVYGIRTDGYSATLSIHLLVDGQIISSGAHNYPGEGDEYHGPVTFDVITDDYGNLITEVSAGADFYSSSNRETHYGNATSKGVVLDAPTKNVSVNCPDGIVCTVDGTPTSVGKTINISVTITGLQWGDYILSVTGATKQSGISYTVTGDVYISVTGILAKHTISITAGNGINVSVLDGSGYSVGDGATVEHYTYITVTCEANSGYSLGQLTINGEKFDNGSTIQVLSDILIVVVSGVLGIAKIFTGTTFEDFHVFIYNGTEWGMYIPFIYNGSSWTICA